MTRTERTTSTFLPPRGKKHLRGRMFLLAELSLSLSLCPCSSMHQRVALSPWLVHCPDGLTSCLGPPSAALSQFSPSSSVPRDNDENDDGFAPSSVHYESALVSLAPFLPQGCRPSVQNGRPTDGPTDAAPFCFPFTFPFTHPRMRDAHPSSAH